MELSRYLKIYPHPHRPGRVLLLATRRCAILDLSVERLDAARNGSLHERERETLIRHGVLVVDGVAERDEMRDTLDRINRTSRHYSAMATLTLECNLSCGYCYEEPFRGRLTMGNPVADQLIRHLTERMERGFDVTVDFYGGEPLLALPLLRRIARELAEAAKRHQVVFTFNIISNGVLLNRPLVQELIPLGLSAVRLTMDGPRDVHDLQRPFVSGHGSFDAVMAAVDAIGDLVPIDLGGNYTLDNFHRFPELLDSIVARGIPPERFKAVVFSPVMPKSDGSTCAPHGMDCGMSPGPELIEAGLFLRQEILRRGFPAPRLKASACMVEFEHDVVVACDGTLYKCPVFMGDTALSVGTLASGIGDYRLSHNLDAWKTAECLDCAYLPLCFGGCRFLRKLRTGTMEGVQCNRSYFDTAIQRLVIQDISYRNRSGHGTSEPGQ